MFRKCICSTDAARGRSKNAICIHLLFNVFVCLFCLWCFRFFFILLCVYQCIDILIDFVKDVRLSAAILAQNEGRRLRRRPSLYSALNIHSNKGQVLRRKLGTAAWPLLNRSAAIYVHICMHVQPACFCSASSVARLAPPGATFATPHHSGKRVACCRRESHRSPLVPLLLLNTTTTSYFSSNIVP